MEDLLKEEDFFINPIKPWKWFMTFYIINGIIFTAYFYLTTSDKGPSEFSGTVMLVAIPLLSVFTMFFTYKNYVRIPLKTAALSILLMMIIYWFYFIAISFCFNQTITVSDAIGALILYSAIAFISIVIILLIINTIQKKKNIRLNT